MRKTISKIAATIAATALLVVGIGGAANAVTITLTSQGAGGATFGFYPGGANDRRGGGIQTLSVTDDAGQTSTMYAYCIEASVTTVAGNDYIESGPADSPPNNFSQPAVQAKVLWILQHSYPTIDLAAAKAESGISTLYLGDVITATQFAIWNLTDPSHASVGTGPQPATVLFPSKYAKYDSANYPASPRILSFMTWLLNNATATPPSPAASLTLSDGAGAAVAGLEGPFVANTTAAVVSVDADNGATIVDATGAPIASPMAVGTEFYVDPTGSPSEATVTVTATATDATIQAGRVLVFNDKSNPDGAQHLVTAGEATVGTLKANTSFVAPKIVPSPSPSPTDPTPTPTDPTPTPTDPTPTPTVTPTQHAATPTPTPTPTPTQHAVTPTDGSTPAGADSELARTGSDAAINTTIGYAAGGLVLLGLSVLVMAGLRERRRQQH